VTDHQFSEVSLEEQNAEEEQTIVVRNYDAGQRLWFVRNFDVKTMNHLMDRPVNKKFKAGTSLMKANQARQMCDKLMEKL